MITALKRLFVITLTLGAVSISCNVAAATPGVTADSIKIGMYGPLTGAQSLGSLPMYGAAAVYKEVNAKGGIHGRKLNLIVQDAACSPNRGIATVKKFIDQDKVFMVNGGWCSAVAIAIKPLFEKHPSMPFVDIAAASSAVSTPLLRNIFQPVATAKTVAQTMLNFAESIPGKKRIAIIAHSDEWANSHIEEFKKLMPALGIKPVAQVVLERGATDATAQVLAIKAAKPTVIFMILYPPEAALFMRQSFNLGVKAPVLGTQVISITNMNNTLKNTANMNRFYSYSSVAYGYDSSEAKPWSDLFRKYYPEKPLNDLSITGMAGAMAVVKALKDAGPDLTQDKFIHAMDNIRDFDPGVSSGPITFTPEDHAGIKVGKMAYIRDGKELITEKYVAPQK